MKTGTHFYTNFARMGNNVLIRDVFNGVKSKRRVKIKPDLFLIPSTPSADSETYSTVTGAPLLKFPQESPKEAKAFIDSYKLVDRTVYGFDRYEYAQINKEYSGTDGLDWKPEHVNVSYVDIETECEGRRYRISHEIKVKKTHSDDNTFQKTTIKNFELTYDKETHVVFCNELQE